MVDSATFERYVQETLDHLYDPAFLLVHPLAALLVPRGGAELPGHALSRILCEAIEALKPPRDAPLHSPAWRSYRYLTLRYVEMETIGQVADALGISPRQCRRDHHDAMSAVCSILWDKYQHSQRGEPSADVASPSAVSAKGKADDGGLDAEVGKMGATFASTVADLDQIAVRAVATLSALAASKNVQIRVDIPPDLPSVLVDRTALRQVLLELLLYAMDRSATELVAVEALAAPGQVRLTIRVRQRGTLAADQVGAAERDDTRLTVSRRLAQMQRASLVVEEHSDGLALQLTLPTDDSPLVLIVDDNADVVQLLRRYLDGAYHVLEATAGAQALALAREARPRVITLDVMMPSQDGWEVLQMLKNDPSTGNIPVIVCSVLQERELALSLGADGFLAKPITARELLSALQRYRSAP
jgi:CheY-like chemotaxis protein